MFEYIKGKITNFEENYLVLENNNIGYKIFTPNSSAYEIDEEYKIYIYEHRREDELSLYGFKNKLEKNLFLKLIGVKGIGCKMAILMIREDSMNSLIEAIEKSDIEYIMSYPKIGEKIAKQIILDLKGKVSVNYSNDLELVDALRKLGYKMEEIRKVLHGIKSEKLEDRIKEGLSLLVK